MRVLKSVVYESSKVSSMRVVYASSKVSSSGVVPPIPIHAFLFSRAVAGGGRTVSDEGRAGREE